MKRSILLLILFFPVFLFAQNSYTKSYDEKINESQKLMYNYTYGSFFFAGSGNYIMSLSSVSYFANGRQQFGLGAGVSSQKIKSDSGNVNFVSVPVFLANKFYLTQNVTNGGLYLDVHAGFNLPVSALFESGEKSGQPVNPSSVRSTGLYGFSLGWRFTGKKEFRELNYIIEIGYRKQQVPVEPDTKKHSSDFTGISLGLSF